METIATHCKSCDDILTEREANSIFLSSGTLVGLCVECRRDLPVELKIGDKQGNEDTLLEPDDNVLPWVEEGGYEEEYIEYDENDYFGYDSPWEDYE